MNNARQGREWIAGMFWPNEEYDLNRRIDATINEIRNVFSSGLEYRLANLLIRKVGQTVMIQDETGILFYFNESEIETLEGDIMQRKLERAG